MRTFSKAWVPALLLLLCLSGCGKRDQMTVVFPKVGSADCAILMTEDATVLIDTGEDGDGDKILKLLSEYGRDRIDLMLISHYDKDHVGGADQILKALPVRRVIGSTSPKESEDYSEYLEALAATGLSEEIPKEKMELSYGPLKLTVYPPKEEVYPSDQSNNSSTAVSAAFGETRVLFTGDAMDARLAELLPDLRADGNTRYDLIKLPHHGRETENAQKLISEVGYEETSAVITSSKKEPEAEELVDTLPVSCYLTREGAVTAVSDGTKLTVSQE